MPALSPATSMAWHLAAAEAKRARQRRIEREAVFIGICYLGTWLRTRTAEGASLPIGGASLGALRAEAEAVEGLLWAVGLSPIRLCHAVRAAVGRGTYRHLTRTKLHRSQACKAAFHRAETSPAAVQDGAVRCLHLLAALLEDPGAVLTDVVAVCGVTVHTLRAGIMATPWMQEARHAPAERRAQGVSHLIYVGADVPR